MMSVTMVLLICDACYCIPQNSGGQPVKDRRHADDDGGGDPPGLKQVNGVNTNEVPFLHTVMNVKCEARLVAAVGRI